MHDQNIICFAKDWSEDATSNHHVMSELAKRNNVLWLNSVSTRVPALTSRRDLRKIGQKLREFRRGPARVRDRLWVYTPLVLPLPHFAPAREVNRHILRLTLSWLRRQLGLKQFQLWSFLPTVADYLGEIGQSLTVYYCVDEWSLFSNVNQTGVQDEERRQAEQDGGRSGI